MNLTQTVILATALLAARGGAADYDYDPPVPGTYALPVVRKAGAGEVLDDSGNRLQLQDLTRGRITVLSFIYTRCAAAKACPYATGVLRELHELSTRDARLRANMRLVSMSFDPGGDTPAQMAVYAALAKTSKPSAEWRFLTTASREKLSPILDAYGQMG